MNCMSANAVVALADGLMTTEERASWQLHLADCGFCRELVAVLVDEARPPMPLPAIGETVGRYKILERIGMGGFGVVFRAHDEQLARDVALKLWRVDALSSGREERIDDLVEEARALAKLSHPNIMAVYDAGRDDERVFLAGELIEGASLHTRACTSERRASSEDLAKWMAQCAEGLAAAHNAGLVHRDVKPDNILIGNDGRARLVDFGLSTSALANTDSSQLVGPLAGTPAYMSPEELRGEPASQYSDQYSLCASFYEASHARRLTLAEDFASLTKAAKESQSPVFDKKLPARLRRVLQRGLQSDPSLRWPNMLALAAALQPRRAGRLAPFAFGGAVAVAASMAALWTSNGSSAGEALRDCELGAAPMSEVWSADRASELRAGFEKLGSSYASEAFEKVNARLSRYADDWRTMAVNTCKATYHEHRNSEVMFDRQMLCLDRRLGEVSALVGFLENVDQSLLERAPRAMSQLRQLSHCSDREAFSNLPALPTDPAALGPVRELEALLAKIEGTRMAGRYEEATTLALEAVAMSKTVGYEPLAAEAAFELGYIWSYRGDDEKSRSYLEQAHHKALAVRDFQTSARAAVELVLVFGMIAENYPKADEWVKHAQSAVAAANNDKNLLANLESNRGDMALQQGHVEEAVLHNETALALRRELYGAGDRSVAQSLNNLGLAKQLQGNFAEAASNYEKAHEIFVKVLGRHHPYVGQTAGNLGSLHMELGEPKKAKARFEESLAIALDAHPSESLVVLLARFNLATSMSELGEREEARAILLTLTAQLDTNFPEEHISKAQVVNSLGVVASELRRHDEAETYFREASKLQIAQHGASHPEALLATLNLAQAVSQQERFEEALSLLDTVLAGYEETLGNDHPMVAITLITRAELYVVLKRPKQALTGLARAEKILNSHKSDRMRVAQLAFVRGQAHWSLGDKAAAIDENRKSLALYAEMGVRGEVGANECKTWLAQHSL